MTAPLPGTSSCRRRAGSAATACARTAPSRRRRSTASKRGIEIAGTRYGPIEAALDKVQGANVWLTIGLREGKNREVRTVLDKLGLTVNRLIRISFGPFQLLDLEPGAVEPVRRRNLIDQLGPKVSAELALTDDEDAPGRANWAKPKAAAKAPSKSPGRAPTKAPTKAKAGS